MVPAPTLPASEFTPCRVIVADDNLDAADSLVLLIQLLGYPARAVYDGSEAVEACACCSPDLMICDIQMPIMDGLQAARQIRAGQAGHEVELVALTSLSSDQDRGDVRAAGFDRHILKPIAVDQLRHLLETCLGAGSLQPA